VLKEKRKSKKMPKFPKPKYPVDFSTMLRIALIEKRPEDRLRFYKLFLRDHIHSGTTIKASPLEIEERLKADLNRLFSDNDVHHIGLWSRMRFEQWKKEGSTVKATKMAHASWLEDAREKRAKNLKKTT
jgi:hypothetical protein